MRIMRPTHVPDKFQVLIDAALERGAKERWNTCQHFRPNMYTAAGVITLRLIFPPPFDDIFHTLLKAADVETEEHVIKYKWKLCGRCATCRNHLDCKSKNCQGCTRCEPSKYPRKFCGRKIKAAPRLKRLKRSNDWLNRQEPHTFPRIRPYDFGPDGDWVR